MKTRTTLVFIVLLVTLFLSACLSQDTQSKNSSQKVDGQVYVTKVIDGDSLMLQKEGKTFEARLFGIDAPELNQAHGKEARQVLRELAQKKYFTLTLKDTDRYGRQVVVLKNPDVNINEHMLVEGHAWLYRKYWNERKAISLEKSAQIKKKGLWRLSRPIPPWEWRDQEHKKR